MSNIRNMGISPVYLAQLANAQHKKVKKMQFWSMDMFTSNCHIKKPKLNHQFFNDFSLDMGL